MLNYQRVNHQFGMVFQPKEWDVKSTVFNWWFGFRWLHRRSSKWNKFVKNWCFWVTIFFCDAKSPQEKRGDDVKWVLSGWSTKNYGSNLGCDDRNSMKFRRDEMWGCEKPPIRGVVERCLEQVMVVGPRATSGGLQWHGHSPVSRNKDMEAILQFVS